MPPAMPKDSQSFLLSDSAMRAASYSTYENFVPALTLTASELQAWKQRIMGFQTRLQAPQLAPQQVSLFDVPVEADLASTVKPFALRRQNTEFWRWQFDDVGVAAMYFVIDYVAADTVTDDGAALLLYIGETVKSNQRWKGEHDCKRYLLNYRQAHYDNGLKSELGVAFWPHAPIERQRRQKLESDLIYRWRSPFNKENWRFWNTPFVGGKQS